jgi:hypothetical protein
MRAPFARRRIAAIAAVAGVAVLVHTSVSRPDGGPAPRSSAAGLDDGGYVALAGRLQRRLDRLWDPAHGWYGSSAGSPMTEVNADLLLVHSVAALRGDSGPTRNDERARAIARFLTSPGAWTDRPPVGADPQVKGPGWVSRPGVPRRHPVFDAEAVDGLVHAYLARDALHLEAGTVARIRDEIHRVATSPDWRWPALRLNQLNWYCDIFAADAIVNGEHEALANGMARHLARFLGNTRAHGDAAGNIGPGLRFHYLPHMGMRTEANFDSPEYANIVLSFARFYGLARADGMRPPARLGLLREWVRRVLAGYWTHGGYLNWDTGLGFYRWHQRKKVPLAQLGLIGVASQPELQPGPQWGAWAKWLLDRGLTIYDALVEREGDIPAALAYGVDTVPQGRDNAYLAAARFESNSMRALEAGLGRAPASRPPALYSYDPDTGRLAVTTPAYNTAIVAVNQHAFPYGGLDIARLFDGEQEVAANIGGRGAAAFGLRALRHGRVVLSTQYGERSYSPAATPLRLTRAPRGVGATAASGMRRAYAGPFSDLRAKGGVSGRGLRATTAYRFTAGWFQAAWTLCGATTVDAAVSFPSWGRGAHVIATLRDGRSVRLTRTGLPLARVRTLHIVSARSGYTVTPLSRPLGAAVQLIDAHPQSSDPDPGPTVQVRVDGTRRVAFGVRIAVDPSR